jgi:hypothetical protein
MLALIVTILFDTTVVKVNDLIDKNFIPLQTKLVIFSVNSSLCLFLQFFIIRYIQSSFKRDRLDRTLKAATLPVISFISLGILATQIGILAFQLFYYGYYDTTISILIITISYGTAAAFLVWLSCLFFSWYRSSHNLIVLLYFVSMLMIAFNLIMTAAFISAKVSDRPDRVGEFVGSSGDISGGRHALLDNIYRVSSFISFFSIWVTTAILMNSYREKLINAMWYWIIMSIPLVYFLITFSYQFILSQILISYVEIDPITVSIILSAFLSLSKPIGGLVFGVAFWNISRVVGYERNIKMYMIISGWGIFLIFAANQAATQIVNPYPPFGLATITVLNLAGYLMLLGIYNSASLVSTNNDLRKLIRERALESNLLNLIGHAEMEKEIQNTVTKIVESQDIEELHRETGIELDGNELRRYIDVVVSEVKKDNRRLPS